MGCLEVLGILIFWNRFNQNPASGFVRCLGTINNVSRHISAVTIAIIAFGTFERWSFLVCYKVLVKICHGSRPITAKRTLIDESFDQFDCPTAANGFFRFNTFSFQLGGNI